MKLKQGDLLKQKNSEIYYLILKQNKNRINNYKVAIYPSEILIDLEIDDFERLELITRLDLNKNNKEFGLSSHFIGMSSYCYIYTKNHSFLGFILNTGYSNNMGNILLCIIDKSGRGDWYSFKDHKNLSKNGIINIVVLEFMNNKLMTNIICDVSPDNWIQTPSKLRRICFDVSDTDKPFSIPLPFPFYEPATDRS